MEGRHSGKHRHIIKPGTDVDQRGRATTESGVARTDPAKRFVQYDLSCKLFPAAFKAMPASPAAPFCVEVDGLESITV